MRLPTTSACCTALLLTALPGLCQEKLDLAEADARERAYQMMETTAARYACELEEHSLEAIGVRSDERYLMVVRTKGSECNEAMWYLSKLAERDDELVFRERPKQPIDGPDGPLPTLDQDLIHEIDPDVEGIPKD